jgi:hypothetical protein
MQPFARLARFSGAETSSLFRLRQSTGLVVWAFNLKRFRRFFMPREGLPPILSFFTSPHPTSVLLLVVELSLNRFQNPHHY